MMASNFRVLVHRNCDNVHLKLIGDFDGSSAHELINLLKDSVGKSGRIFIHTNQLRRVHPFGQSVFNNNLDFLNGEREQVVITGEHAEKLSLGRYGRRHRSGPMQARPVHA
jgi:anti-anti-sigma regulatory factor